MKHERNIVHLTGGEVSCVIDALGAVPRILHWGGRLGVDDVATLAATAEPSVAYSSFDAARRFSLFPVSGEGWSGSPAIEWHRAGTHADPQLVVSQVSTSQAAADGTFSAVEIALWDAGADALVTVSLTLDAFGVLRARQTVSSTAQHGSPLDLAALRFVMPLPTTAVEITDLTGRWTRERSPQRIPVSDGAHRRSTRRGRPGHDAPLVTMVGTQNFQFRTGQVWAAHSAWSGDSDVSVERIPEGAGVHGAVVAIGELLAPGDIRLAAGETYEAPDVVLAWSDAGIDGISAALHGYARALDAHPASPRLLTLNTWEAVYFDHDPDALIRLAEVAAKVGVERFVLDDGWFEGRSNDRSGLGDWFVDTDKWPNGVQELSDAVHGQGMEFGLWFEPEMVNPESGLARLHPDWLLGNRANAARWRHQLVLDLTNPEVGRYLLERIDDAVRSIGVDYIKWDHNRELHGAVSHDGGAPAVHRQTRAFYALLDAVRELHPSLEIESCAAGGARVDLGILSRVQRVWASDTNDPVERQTIQRWTSVLVPPEVMGSHIGPERAHTTGRSSSLQFRMATALFGHAGIEWDLTTCSDAELASISNWASVYKELRPLLHAGRTVRADLDDEGSILHGVVSMLGDQGLFAWVRVSTSRGGSSSRVRIPGLIPSVRYAVVVREDFGPASRHQVADPAWMASPESFTASGSFLAEVGLPLPILNPGAAMLFEFRS